MGSIQFMDRNEHLIGEGKPYSVQEALKYHRRKNAEATRADLVRKFPEMADQLPELPDVAARMPTLLIPDTIGKHWTGSDLTPVEVTRRIMHIVEAKFEDIGDVHFWPQFVNTPEIDYAGISGFAYGHIALGKTRIRHNEDGTCSCDFSDMSYRFQAFWNALEGGAGLIYIKGRALPADSCPSTQEHERWHTDGVPESVAKALKKHYGFELGEYELGYRGKAKEKVEAATQAIREVLQRNVDSRAECERELRRIFQEHLTGAEALDAIGEAGLWHYQDRTGATYFRGSYADQEE